MHTFQAISGPLAPETVGMADAHGHVYIDPPANAPTRIELRDEGVSEELKEFHAAGGTLIVDCQPGGCGRDAQRLLALAQSSGLHITATTGFHQEKYYPPGYWLWSADAQQAAAYFKRELLQRMDEATAKATTLKVGYEGSIKGQTRVLMEAAAEAALASGALILFHTERGRNVEALLPFFSEHGVTADRLYLCHVDKRPDRELHMDLAKAGVLLGYDTFIRPQYKPREGAWPLVEALVSEGLAGHIAVGLDLALRSMWRYRGGPGLPALPHQIIPRMQEMGLEESTIRKLTGQNIAQRLVFTTVERKI